MSERLVVVSTDCHAGAPLLGYREYLPADRHDDFDRWAAEFADPWDDFEEREVKPGVASFDSEINWDSDLRRDVLDADGIAAEVIFPNTAPPFFPSGVLSVAVPQTRPDYELRMDGLRAHNRWLAEFCAELPHRRVGVAQVFLNDVDDTVAEIRRFHAMGLTSILLPGDAPGGLVPLYPRELEPVWQVCEELGVVVHKHGNFAGEPVTEEMGPGGAAAGALEGMFWNRRGVAHLILAGVFERYPDLKFVQTETGADWVPSYLRQCDGLYEAAQVEGSFAEYFSGKAIDGLTRRPSEYFATNCWIGASFMSQDEAARRHEIGLDRLMWGSDLPHAEGTYPNTLKALRATFEHVPLEEIEQILSTNPATVYGLDPGRLREIADRIGPLASDVRTPLADDEWPAFPHESISPAFTRPRARARA